MNPEPTSVESVTNDNSISLPFPSSRWGRILYGLFVVIMPPLAFWATELFKPEWQNGQLDAYLSLLLSPVASLVFFPLLAYSVIYYLLLLVKPDQYSQSLVLRTGVYTGTFLALQYSVLALLLFSEGPAFYLVWLIPFVLPPVYRLAVKKWSAKSVNSVLIVLTGIIYLASALRMRTPLLPLALVLAGLTVASPFWIFLMFLRASVWLYKKEYDTKLTIHLGLGSLAWLTTYIVAWRYDILKMYELYAALPPQPPPDCYIATAAARGHPRFVQSQLIYRPDGTSMRINPQLQILKCTELGLMAVNPRLHAVLRMFYDMVGKPIAGRIRNPFLADIAYLFFKPWEWCAMLVLMWIVPEIRLFSKRMYMKE